MIWNIAVLLLSMFVCNMLFKLYRRLRRPKNVQKFRTFFDMRPTILKFHRHSAKFVCNSCGNAQTVKLLSRCHREGFCSRCLQKKWRHGKVVFWG